MVIHTSRDPQRFFRLHARISSQVAIQILLVAVILTFIPGCSATNKLSSDVLNSRPGGKALSVRMNPVTPQQAAAVHANELGRVLVLEYHNIIERKGQYNQSPDQLRSDLKTLYDNGFVTLDINDYLSGHITTPAGKSPVVITFDDASKYQFRYLNENGTQVIDPDCAVGILDAFAKAHPGFGNHATFFVLPSGFGQPSMKAEKYHYLVTHGYAIGNHTWSHSNMAKMTPAKVQEELGRADADIHHIVPDALVDVMAYPDGMRPRIGGKPNTLSLAHGQWQGHSYQIKAAFLVGSDPAPSPYSVRFKPYAIPRVQAIEPDIHRWIKYLKTHPSEDFVSDGNSDFISIPRSLSHALNVSAVGRRKVVEY